MNIENELICFDAFIEIINPRNSFKKNRRVNLSRNY